MSGAKRHGPTWVDEIAAWLSGVGVADLPQEVRQKTSRLVLDSVACALGARDHEAAHAALAAVGDLGGADRSSLIGESAGSSPQNAILYNGTLIRALDCNDIFFKNGVAGHPSDNIAVALAWAEAEHASGQELLRAIALGYELYWRLRVDLFDRAPGYGWDHVSVSGLVGACMAGLLMRLDERRLAAALANGAAQTYSLSELRGGEIAQLKASANAVTAQVGAQGALLAKHGMTGPAAVLEGRRGLLAALGIAGADARTVHDALLASIDRWHILDATIKPFPAIGTSQGAIAATLEIVRRGSVRAADVESVTVQFADLPITREQIADEERRDPRTRETADHSFPFLVAAAIEDGELGPAQFAGERWLRPSTRDLMARITFTADARLNDYAATGYPARVQVQTRDGRTVASEMLHVPGSPGNPYTDADFADKLRRLAPDIGDDWRAALVGRLLGIERVDDVASLGPLLRGTEAAALSA